MALDRILHQNQPIRSEEQALADRLGHAPTFTQKAWFGLLPQTPRASDEARAAVNCPQAKALRCEPLTRDEITTLSDDELVAYEERATYRASQERTCSYDPSSDLMADGYDKIAKAARAELSRRSTREVA